MKKKDFLITGFAIAGVILSSCEDRFDSIVESIDKKAKIDSLAASKDNLETMYMMQSNSELILADRIISKSTGFVLDISKQEADELQIPDKLYQKYVDKVNGLNKQEINKTK
jgi:hypothetical protein